jgi:hypothetical protein
MGNMARKFVSLALLAFVGLALAGCGLFWVWKSSTFSSNDQPFFDVTLTTTDFLSLQVEVTNKSSENIEIIWPKTSYIDGSNSTNGVFMSGQEVYWEDKEKPINPTIIFPRTKATKTVFPAVLASWHWRRGWDHNWLPLGLNGILLTVKVGDKEISRQMTINVEKTRRY